MDQFFANIKLRYLPIPLKLLVTFFLLTIGTGYLISLINLNFQYGPLDGEPGVSPADLERAFYGDRTTTRLAAKINGGSMEQYLPDPTEKNKILNWIQDGAHEDGFKKIVQPILNKNCTRCHNATGLMSYRPLTSYEEVMAVVKIDRGEPPALWARVAHTHILSIGLIFGILGTIFSFTTLSNRLKSAIIVIPFIDLVLDFGARYLAKFNADLVYVMMTTGAILGLMMAIMILWPLYEMWLKKPTAR